MAGLFDGLPMKARTFAQGMFQIDAGATPEAAARKREMLAAMLMGGRKPQSVGEGVMDGVTRALSGWQMGRLNKAEGDKRKSESDAFRALRGQPPAPTGPLSVLGMTPDYNVPDVSVPYVAQGQQPTATMPINANPQIAGAFAGAGGLPASLIRSESGGNWSALNSEGYGGRAQMGEARLADAARAGIIPAGMTGLEYSKQPPAVQQAVEEWHVGDIMKDLGQYVGVDPDGPGPIPPMTPDNLVSIAHLGGTGGAKKFIESGGQYNPSDSNGTSLAKYATMHANGGGGMAIGAPAYSGPPIADLQAAVTNPWLSQEERALAQSMLGQAMQQSDPLRQLQIQQAQVDLQRSQMPERREPIKVGDVLLDPDTLEPIYDGRSGGGEPLMNAGGGQIYNPNTGEWITAPNGAGQDAPAAVQTLQWRAEQAGLKPGTPEYAQFMVDGGSKSGFAIDVDPATGAVSVRQGAGAGTSAKPYTEAQSKDIGFSTRMRDAEGNLAPVESKLTSVGDRALDKDPTGLLRGSLQDKDYQLAKQAGSVWLLAFLRKDSGAATTKEEDALYGATFLPQPGDGPEVIQQKRQSRERAMKAVEAGMSPLQIVAQERALMDDAPPPPPAGAAGSLTRAQFEAMPEVQRIVREGGATMDAAWAAYQRKYGGGAAPADDLLKKYGLQ